MSNNTFLLLMLMKSIAVTSNSNPLSDDETSPLTMLKLLNSLCRNWPRQNIFLVSNIVGPQSSAELYGRPWNHLDHCGFVSFFLCVSITECSFSNEGSRFRGGSGNLILLENLNMEVMDLMNKDIWMIPSSVQLNDWRLLRLDSQVYSENICINHEFFLFVC